MLLDQRFVSLSTKIVGTLFSSWLLSSALISVLGGVVGSSPLLPFMDKNGPSMLKFGWEKARALEGLAYKN